MTRRELEELKRQAAFEEIHEDLTHIIANLQKMIDDQEAARSTARSETAAEEIHVDDH